MPELQKVNTDVFINLRDRTDHIIVSANRGDAHSRTIRFHFTYEGEIYELPEGTTARFLGTRPDGAGIIEELPCTVIGNQVLYEMTPYVLNIPGDVHAKIELRNDETEQILTTVSFLIHIPPDPFDENTIIKTDEFSVLNQLITTIEKAVDDVNAALVQVEQMVDEANQAIAVIYDTNEKMQEVISDAQTVIGDMEQKLAETDEKVAGWQTDIETAIADAEKSVSDTLSQAQADVDSMIAQAGQDVSTMISQTEQSVADTLSQAQTDVDSMIAQAGQDISAMLSQAEQDVSGLVSQVEAAISQADEAANQANQATANANQATSAANEATAGAVTATEQADQATERAIAAAEAAEAAAARQLPIATGTTIGAVKASEQVAVAEDGTMSILSVPFEALPEETRTYSPFLIQAEEPPGDPGKAWINSVTHVMSYYDGTAWVKLASIWS